MGFANVLKKLPAQAVKQCGLLALSTTLAANACVEGKGGRGKLILIGVEKKHFEECCKDYGIDGLEQVYLLECTLLAEEKKCVEPDWELFLRDIPNLLEGCDCISIVQVFCKGASWPLIIVRSDGSFMNETFAKNHPVETLLCGPEASIQGAKHLTGARDALVVDMGGTATDIMHLKGDFQAFNKEASAYAARCAAHCTGFSVEQMCCMVYNMVVDRLYKRLYRSLITAEYPELGTRQNEEALEKLAEISLFQAKEAVRVKEAHGQKESPFTSFSLRTRAVLTQRIFF